ncbi:hypothetical protein [Nocardia sp. CNY236]|nr:hypothetical protein [Nocardia sp. CNY236]
MGAVTDKGARFSHEAFAPDFQCSENEGLPNTHARVERDDV